MRFTVLARDANSKARTGRLETPHGVVSTPVFMPVGTVGAVKTMTPDDLVTLGAEIILGNTYHLMLRPGADVVEKAGGLHGFAAWPRPILTDSGGFQVLSLADLRQLTDEGVTFRSHVDGREEFLSPERAVEIQKKLGSDIQMVLDECPPHDGDRTHLLRAVERTIAWAARAKREFSRQFGRVPGAGRPLSPGEGRGEGIASALFGIVQGGTETGLRAQCAGRLREIGFDGYAMGGLSVGESKEATYAAVASDCAALPDDQPRYLMGVGTPEDIWEAVASGTDMFDCVLPTRTARNGLLFTSRGRVNLKNAAWAEDFSPPDPDCSCYTCRTFTKVYLRHLFRVGEYLLGRLATLHNLHFYLSMMRTIREAIAANRFSEARAEFFRRYSAGDAALQKNL